MPRQAQILVLDPTAAKLRPDSLAGVTLSVLRGGREWMIDDVVDAVRRTVPTAHERAVQSAIRALEAHWLAFRTGFGRVRTVASDDPANVLEFMIPPPGLGRDAATLYVYLEESHRTARLAEELALPLARVEELLRDLRDAGLLADAEPGTTGARLGLAAEAPDPSKARKPSSIPVPPMLRLPARLAQILTLLRNGCGAAEVAETLGLNGKDVQKRIRGLRKRLAAVGYGAVANLPEVIAVPNSLRAKPRLTERQAQMLAAVSAGWTVPEIVVEYGISTGTVNALIKALKERFGARSLRDLMPIGVAYGYAELPAPIPMPRALLKPQRWLFALLTQGLDDDQIAAELGITMVAAKSRIGRVLRALRAEGAKGADLRLRLAARTLAGAPIPDPAAGRLCAEIPLTPRQQKVLDLVRAGLTSPQIAEHLGLKTNYVITVRRAIRRRGMDKDLGPIRTVKPGCVRLPSAELVGALRALPSEAFRTVDLTPRQAEIIALTRDGETVGAIAKRLNLSPVTVAQHRWLGFRALGISSAHLAAA